MEFEKERNYGFVNSKIVRPAKVGIGKTRRKLADRLYESALEGKKKSYKSY